MVKIVCVTGATGVMGSESVRHLLTLDDVKLRLLIKDTDDERYKAKEFTSNPKVEAYYGNLRNYGDILRFISGCDYVLHIGGMVSPYADDKPKETFDVNVGGAQNIVNAILVQPNKDDIKVCYIGSVAETGDRNYPIHWGRTGDPIKVSMYDHYGVSKAIAERVFAESGLKHWAVFRQSGILHPGLISKFEPIMFHVPINGVLEWCTVEDSGRLMKNFVDFNLPENFWRRFYNIGSGEMYRLTNYEFENLLLSSCNISDITTSFAPNWFATKNFHGQYYVDGDVLESFLKFRENVPTVEYFQRLMTKVPIPFRLVKFIRIAKKLGFLAYPVMKAICKDKDFGPLGWLDTNDEMRIKAHFGSVKECKAIPQTWSEFPIKHYDTSIKASEKYILSHGYDETKDFESLTVEDLQKAAEFRGGSLISKKIDSVYKPVTWKCGHCHREFEATPNLILKGGHWCPHCFLPSPSTGWDYGKIAQNNPFFAQVWNTNHTEEENDYYSYQDIFNKECFDSFPINQKKSTKKPIHLIIFFLILVVFLIFFNIYYSSVYNVF